ncbi:MAG TPA: dipeptidase [Actinomycetota bacterium]|nr:dipeptidase [Actinomycetota bacterium]
MASDRIAELLRSAPLIDGHNDLVWALRKAAENGESHDVGASAPSLHTDLPRLEQGGVRGQFWSVYVPSDLADPHAAVTMTLEQIDALFALVRSHPDRLELARTADDVERIAAAGRVASMIGVEGGQSIGSSLGALRILARLGAGYLTLTHNDDTPWADSGTGERAHGGLTSFGEEVVRELNHLGMLVDLSHVSDDTMRQAIEVSSAPVFFSHSNARALCDVPRNVPDDVIELVGRTDGVICATFVPWFLTAEGAEANEAEWREIRRLKEEHPDDPDAVRAAVEQMEETQPTPASSIQDVADHIDHIRDVAGIDHVGVGGDFDGLPGMPEGLEDVSTYPALFAELVERGYDGEALLKVAGRNVLRVMRAAERVAAGSGRDGRPFEGPVVGPVGDRGAGWTVGPLGA